MTTTTTTATTTMKAIEFTAEGEPNVVNISKPEPKQGQVLIKVVASAIDTALDSVIQRTFLVSSFVHSNKGPLTLGWHYSGIVEAVGDDVSAQLQVGQHVFGHLQYDPSTTQGAFSEYVVVSQDECAVKPASIDFAVAAAATTEPLTALQAVRDVGGLEGGKSVLVVGAAGAVGSAAVQIAKASLGAHVTAVCSAKDLDKVKALGADECINRSKVNTLYEENRKFDVIFDTPNAMSPVSSLKLLNKGGVFIATLPSLGLLAGIIWTLFQSKKVKFVEVKSKREDLELVGQWLEDGSLNVPVDSTFKARDMARAMDRYADKQKKGRVVINVRDGF